MICKLCIHEIYLDKNDSWIGILRVFMFATRTTFHSTNRFTPTQLVFVCDKILNVRNEFDWAYMKERKGKISLKNKIQENKTQKKHEHKVNYTLLIKMQTKLKYCTNTYTVLFKVTKFNNNRTVRMRWFVLQTPTIYGI